MDSRNCGYCEQCGAGNYDACTSPGAATREGEPVAYRYKDVRGHWRYVGAPMTMGWAVPSNLSFEPLYATPPAPTTEPAAKAITGLTEEESYLLADRLWEQGHISSLSRGTAKIFAHVITLALAEKNGLAVQGDGK